MYPQTDLKYLEQRKSNLRGRIHARRSACAEELGRVLRPVVWGEGLWAKWKAISPIVKLTAVPVGLLLRDKLFPKSGGVIGGLIRWGPLALNLFRSMR